jgi:hypothetical protein
VGFRASGNIRRVKQAGFFGEHNISIEKVNQKGSRETHLEKSD